MLNDLRFAFRGLARRPGSTALAVFALALGIGANAAIFSFVEGIVLRPLPFPDADRLVDLRQSGGPHSTSLGAVSPRDLEDFKALDAVFSGLSGSSAEGRNVSFTGSPERLFGLAIEPAYFDVIGILPRIGRAFVAGEDQPGNDAVVVVSHRLFSRRFDGAPDILSRSLIMDGRPYRIVGVMPSDFRTIEDLAADAQIDYFVPNVLDPGVRINRGEHILSAIGRLQEGVSLAQANAALAEISNRLSRSEPDSNTGVLAVVRPAQDAVAGSLQTPMLLLFGASALIFLIAAANVASLLAARAAEESREVAVRVALGASRRLIVRESLVRSLLLAGAGCLLGLLAAVWLKGLLLALAPARTPRLEEIAINGGVVAAACLLSLLGAAVFGMLPAFAAFRTDATEVLRAGSRSGAGRGTRWSRNAIVACEIALAVLPLLSATLLVRSLAALRGVDLGFDTEGVLVANLPLPEAQYKTGDDRFVFFDRLAEKTRSLPGVSAAGFANRFPMRGGWRSGIQFDGENPDESHAVPFQAVGGEYFEALGIGLRRGRDFDSSDTKGSPSVAVVNEAFVRSLLKGDPIGQRFRRGSDRPWISIVGVVADIRRDGKLSELEPQAYVAAAQTDLYPVRLADFAVRTSNPAAMVKPLQEAVWSIDPAQPLMNVRTLSETIDGALSPRRFQTLLLALFAGLALLLALIGVYGVVSTTVARRTQEIGVRMALGARASSIAGMVIRQSLAPAFLGVIVGLVTAAGLVRSMSSLLFGVAPFDPASFLAAPVALLFAVVVASAIPARRAARVEPTTALRDE